MTRSSSLLEEGIIYAGNYEDELRTYIYPPCPQLPKLVIACARSKLIPDWHGLGLTILLQLLNEMGRPSNEKGWVCGFRSIPSLYKSCFNHQHRRYFGGKIMHMHELGLPWSLSLYVLKSMTTKNVKKGTEEHDRYGSSVLISSIAFPLCNET